MDFCDGLSAELPAPRDDEPGGLRDDILDELADHLACAYRRELLRGADAATAKQRVQVRFGDPAALARRLWFDAMRGKIMSQRILVVCCILLTVVSLSLAFVLWNQARDVLRLAAIEHHESEMARRRAESVQQQMLEQLQAVSKSVNSPKSPDWIPVSFKLTQDTPAGPPAVGLLARLGRGSQGAEKEDAIQRESDAEGMIDFGVVQPGDWGFLLRRAAKDGGSWLLTGKLSALPGTLIQKSIVCPRNDEPMAPVSIRIEWPPDLADKGLAVVACLRHEGFTYQPPLHWREVHDLDSESTIGIFHVLCGLGADRVLGVQRGSPGLWQLSANQPVPAYAPGSSIPSPGVEPYRPNQVYIDLALRGTATDPSSIQLLHGRNQLQKIAVVRPWKKLAAAKHAERFELLACASLIGPAFEPVLELGQPPEDAVSSLGLDGAYVLSNLQDITAGSSAPTYDAEKDQPNVWTFYLPDGLTHAVRETLKAQTKK
jgi:hypothetical protein